MISEASLRGLILEETLARLLLDAGYQLLNDPADDPVALLSQGNGLCVRGRGADHQADVLGELTIPIPFSYPIRLFVEAKFWGDKVGLLEARNALGVVNDVNEFYTPRGQAADALATTCRYHYRYALFSASGFTKDAQTFALAQQISLIDLQGPSFSSLLDTVRATATALLAAARAAGQTRFPTGQTRTALRLALGTRPPTTPAIPPSSTAEEQAYQLALTAQKVSSEPEPNPLPPEALAKIAAALSAQVSGSIALAFPRTSFMIPLLLPDPSRFDQALEQTQGPINIQPRFLTGANGSEPESANWSLVVAPLGALLTTEGDPGEDASPGGSMFVFHRGSTAQFDYETVRREAGLAYDDPIKSPVRQLYATRSAAAHDRRTSPSGPAPDIEWVFQDDPPWPAPAVRALIELLQDEDPLRARVVVETARRGGLIEREAVYDLANYDDSRTLTGFTRPVNRLTQRLMEAGTLTRDHDYIFRAWFPRAGRASAFIMPEYAAEIIRRM
jgi:hypothetical protein